MSEAAFRVYFGTQAATAEDLRRIERIVVHQERDAIWQARIRMSLCLDAQGSWLHNARDILAPLSRIRIELKVSDTFVPLIDGLVSGYDSGLDAQPGRSHVTVVVRDDSVMLHREDRSARYEQKTDREIVEEVFGRHRDVLDPSDEIGTLTGDSPRDAFQRDSDLVFLQQLGKAYNMHAYVLPTAQIGKSKAHFMGVPREASTDHPPLVLLGTGRNLSHASIEEDSESPERSRTTTLRISDGQLVPYESTYSDAALMRELPPVPEDTSAIRNVAPADSDREDPSTRARAQTERRSYNVKLTGRVVPCYPAVLAPYLKVQVQGANSVYSGDWVIHKVTHQITPSVYVQEFVAKSNALSRTGAAPALPRII